jgi:hypothetical protein
MRGSTESEVERRRDFVLTGRGEGDEPKKLEEVEDFLMRGLLGRGTAAWKHVSVGLGECQYKRMMTIESHLELVVLCAEHG